VKQHWAGAATVLLLAVAGLGFIVVSPSHLFNRHSDLVSQHLAAQTVLYDSWRNGGGFPLWRDDQLSGFPAFTNPQASYSHPLHLLFALFPPAQIVGLVIWLEMLASAIGVYVAGIALRLSPPARLLAATGALFSFKTLLAAYAGWLPVLAGVAALPFVFAAVMFVLDKPSLAAAIGLAFATAFALHAGHPQVTYYTAVFAALWCSVHLLRTYRVDRRRSGRMLVTLAGGAALALGLSAYRLLPILADLPLATRSDASGAFFFGGAPLAPAGLLTLLYPEYHGSPLDDSFAEGWEYIVYLGAVPTVLAALAFASDARGPYSVPLRIGAVLSLALAIDSPVVRVVSTIVPGYGLFRMPARILFLTAFFAYCLAGIGLDEILRRVPTRTRQFVAWLLIAGVAAEGTFWALRYLRTAAPMPFPPEAAYVATLRTSEPARIMPFSTSTPSYGSAAIFGLELVTGYDPYNFRHYQAYMDVARHGRVGERRADVWYNVDQVARWDLVDALNVAFVISQAPLQEPPPGYVLAHAFADEPQFRIYEGMAAGPVYV
jgi:hypothetical protein